MASLCALRKGEWVLNISGIKDFEPRNLFTPSHGRQLLKILEHGPFAFVTGSWRNEKGDYIYMHSVEALYDRYLVKIVIDVRNKKHITVELTDIGLHAARDIQRQRDEGEQEQKLSVREAASLFITEIASP